MGVGEGVITGVEVEVIIAVESIGGRTEAEGVTVIRGTEEGSGIEDIGTLIDGIMEDVSAELIGGATEEIIEERMALESIGIVELGAGISLLTEAANASPAAAHTPARATSTAR